MWCKNAQKSTKSDCDCSQQIVNLQQENRLLQERVKQAEKERDDLLLSLSVLSKSAEAQKAREDKGNSLLDVAQTTSSLSSNIICDQADENNETAHASPQVTGKRIRGVSY